MPNGSNRMLRVATCLIASAIPSLLFICPVATAEDYRIDASGPLFFMAATSDWFDGTVHRRIPPLLDTDRLTGGSFAASFRFSTVTPIDGTEAYYDLSGTTAGMTFDLLDARGQLVYHSGDSFAAEAMLTNDWGLWGLDLVWLAAQNKISDGSHFPTPIYTPPGELKSVANFSFYDHVSPSVDYITDLSIPTDAATYLAFSDKQFNVVLTFGDGDVANLVPPFQYVELSLGYEITTISVTQVPEPRLIALLFAVSVGLLAIRRR